MAPAAAMADTAVPIVDAPESSDEAGEPDTVGEGGVGVEPVVGGVGEPGVGDVPGVGETGVPPSPGGIDAFKSNDPIGIEPMCIDPLCSSNNPTWSFSPPTWPSSRRSPIPRYGS